MKTRSKAGFTLAETLLAVLLLLLVSMLLANGIPLAKDAYDRVVVAANARVMLSNAVAVLRDELSTARNIRTVAENDTIEFVSANTGTTSKIGINAEGTPRLTLTEYSDLIPGGLDDTPLYDAETYARLSRDLVPSGKDERLYVSYTGQPTLSAAGDVITIKDLAVYKESDAEKASPMAGPLDLNVRIIIPSANP